MIKIRKAKDSELRFVKELSDKYNFSVVSEEEKLNEGFVSVELNLSLLEKINHDDGVLIALDENRIIGYELPISIGQAEKISLLIPFVEIILSLKYLDSSLNKLNTIIECQILIDKGYKGRGIAEELHKKFRKLLKDKYSFIVTEVSNQNPRSLHVHVKRLGFEILKKYKSDNREWFVLIQKTK